MEKSKIGRRFGVMFREKMSRFSLIPGLERIKSPLNRHKRGETRVIDIIKIARIWREQNGYVGRGGMVVVYADEMQGWGSELSGPDNWVPGCVAVAEDGRTWITLGGNSEHGALMWLPIDLMNNL